MQTIKPLFTVFLLSMTLVLSAQSNVSKPKSFFIAKEVKPPVLSIDANSVRFFDAGGNNAIDANENCAIRFQLTNVGTGEGKECVAVVYASGTTDDVKFENRRLENIPVGKTVDVEIPVIAGMGTKNGRIEFAVEITEVQGFGTEPIHLSVNTREFTPPRLEIVDHSVTGSSSALKRGVPFDLQLLLQNTQYGLAEDVTVKVSVPDGVMLIDGDLATRSFATMKAGETKSLVYPIIALVQYKASTIPVKVTLSEKYGKYSENKTITLALNQHMSSTKIVVDEQKEERQDIVIGHLSSAVDKDIPAGSVVNDKTFAVIIANENYQYTADVPYAINDGGVFRNYCERTLGIPGRNIHYITNATLNNIQGEISWLENVMRSYEGQAKALFYYAGHGIPDEVSKDSYLLPVDGFGNNVKTGYKLQNLYASLGAIPSKSVTVFLDACFSGANRDGQMLNPARGVVIRANDAAPSGNMVVFSAAQGYETAMPFREESHGLFTYYLLKKLQETAGDVTYEELVNYVQRNVRQQSSILNKPQTPSIIPSSTVGDSWKNWKMK